MRNVRITKCYKFGQVDPKAKSVPVAVFAMDVDHGTPDRPSTGTKTAIAFERYDQVWRALPDLEMAEVVSFVANGFVLRGFCSECFKRERHPRKFYCEWFVMHPE